VDSRLDSAALVNMYICLSLQTGGVQWYQHSCMSVSFSIIKSNSTLDPIMYCSFKIICIWQLCRYEILLEYLSIFLYMSILIYPSFHLLDHILDHSRICTGHTEICLYCTLHHSYDIRFSFKMVLKGECHV
jgi:hypothetical protein